MSERTHDAGSHWDELLTVALLGTDRRRPPDPPAGPVADTVADLDMVCGDSAPEVRMLNQVATMALAKRLAVLPGPVVPLLAAPPADDRRWCPVAAVGSWRAVIDEWPLLEDEWLHLAFERTVRLPGDLLMDLLDRHRTDFGRRRLVQRIAGPIVPWTSEHLGLATVPTGVDDSELPELPVHPEVPWRRGDPTGLSEAIVSVLGDDSFSGADRLLLEHGLARCDPGALPEVIVALDAVIDEPRSGVAAAMLASLTRARMAMRASFADEGQQ